MLKPVPLPDSAGFRDEAIFLHLLDESLVEEYLEYRESHADELVEYLCTVVVELPEGLVEEAYSEPEGPS